MTAEAPGVETLLHAVDDLIDNKGLDSKGNPKEFYLKPVPFGKRMKGLSVHDGHNLMSIREIRAFKNQLLKILMFWNDIKRFGKRKINGMEYNWKCEETGNSSTVRLKFTPTKR